MTTQHPQPFLRDTEMELVRALSGGDTLLEQYVLVPRWETRQVASSATKSPYGVTDYNLEYDDVNWTFEGQLSRAEAIIMVAHYLSHYTEPSDEQA